jgi:hypothetical protein
MKYTEKQLEALKHLANVLKTNYFSFILEEAAVNVINCFEDDTGINVRNRYLSEKTVEEQKED